MDVLHPRCAGLGVHQKTVVRSTRFRVGDRSALSHRSVAPRESGPQAEGTKHRAPPDGHL
jgi:hypothetical protein